MDSFTDNIDQIYNKVEECSKTFINQTIEAYIIEVITDIRLDIKVPITYKNTTYNLEAMSKVIVAIPNVKINGIQYEDTRKYFNVIQISKIQLLKNVLSNIFHRCIKPDRDHLIGLKIKLLFATELNRRLSYETLLNADYNYIEVMHEIQNYDKDIPRSLANKSRDVRIFKSLTCDHVSYVFKIYNPKTQEKDKDLLRTYNVLSNYSKYDIECGLISYSRFVVFDASKDNTFDKKWYQYSKNNSFNFRHDIMKNYNSSTKTAF